MTALLLLLPCTTRAGSYSDPVYSGGTVTDDSGVATLFPFDPSTNNSNGWYVGNAVIPSGRYGQPTDFTDVVQGPLTATFTWQSSYPGEPAPPTVIVKQYCQASWGEYMNYASVLTGASDNGLGLGSTNNTLYTIQTPADDGSVTVVCSPSASISGNTGTIMMMAGAGVSYSAAVYPVTLNFTGTTIIYGLQEALTGQRITATLNSPFPVDPNSYAWSASGNMFKNYDPYVASNQKTELSDTDYFQPSFTFYDATAETVSPSCYARITCPDGTVLAVNVQQPVFILKPTETRWGVSVAPTPTSSSDGPYSYNYLVNGTFSPQYGVQVTWDPITITVPAPFPGGQACLVQIGNFNRVDTRVAVNGASNTYIVIPASQGLDAGFPYPFTYQVDAQGNIIPDNNGMGIVLSPPQWNVPGSGAGGDRPSIICEPPLVNGDNGGDDWRSSTDTDQFDTWTMYRPPAVGNQPTVWVPLQTIHWGWSGSANVQTDANGDVVLDANNNAQWNFTGPQINSPGTPTNTLTFPIWSAVIPYGLTMGPPTAH